MENQFLIDSEYLSAEALEKKHRLETDPSSRKSHMEYMPGMEQITSDVMENVMTVSDYNRVAKLCGFETVSIKDDEYGVVANYKQMVKYRDMSLQAGTTIQVNGYELKPGMSKCQAGDVQISTQAINTGIIIVPDGVLTGVTPISESLLAIYNTCLLYTSPSPRDCS